MTSIEKVLGEGPEESTISHEIVWVQPYDVGFSSESDAQQESHEHRSPIPWKSFRCYIPRVQWISFQRLRDGMESLHTRRKRDDPCLEDSVPPPYAWHRTSSRNRTSNPYDRKEASQSNQSTRRKDPSNGSVLLDPRVDPRVERKENETPSDAGAMRQSSIARLTRKRVIGISWKLPWFCFLMTMPLIIILLPWMVSEWDPGHDFYRPLVAKKLSDVALHEGSSISKHQEMGETTKEDGSQSIPGSRRTYEGVSGSTTTTGLNTRHRGDHIDEEALQANGYRNGVRNPANSTQGNHTERKDRNLPRIAYLIMSSRGESLGLVSLLAAIYHPANAYAVHCDARIPEEEKDVLQSHVRDNMPSNVLWMKSSAVTWGGISMLLVTLRGIAQLRRDLGDNWDYFINLSASDMPLLPQDYIANSLKNVPPGASFMSGAPYKGPDAGSGIYRTKQLIVDNAIHLGNNLNSTMEWPGGERSDPAIFVPYKGEGWFILSKDLAKQATDSAEYWFGILLSYFSNWFAADESFMQTLACTESGREASTTYLDNFRHIVWSNIALGHPDVLEGTEALAAALSSGAFFARKFPVDGIERRALIHYIHSWPNSSVIQQNTGHDDVIALYKKFSQLYFAEVSKTTNVSVADLEGRVEIALLKLHELRPMQIQALDKRISQAEGKDLCRIPEQSTSE